MINTMDNLLMDSNKATDNINIKMAIYIEEDGHKILNVILIVSLYFLPALVIKVEYKMENIMVKEFLKQIKIYITKVNLLMETNMAKDF
jgi:hypothetical protein